MIIDFVPEPLDLLAICTCNPKHVESVTTAKASAEFFMVLLFSFGNGQRSRSILSLEREIKEARKGIGVSFVRNH
jgi:hypothetical protein